jgi:hypothetical protein
VLRAIEALLTEQGQRGAEAPLFPLDGGGSRAMRPDTPRAAQTLDAPERSDGRGRVRIPLAASRRSDSIGKGRRVRAGHQTHYEKYWQMKRIIML